MDFSTWGLARDAGGDDTTVAVGVRNVSHRCINLSAEDAAWYYDNTGNGDPFIVVVGPGRQFDAFDGQGD